MLATATFQIDDGAGTDPETGRISALLKSRILFQKIRLSFAHSLVSSAGEPLPYPKPASGAESPSSAPESPPSPA